MAAITSNASISLNHILFLAVDKDKQMTQFVALLMSMRADDYRLWDQMIFNTIYAIILMSAFKIDSLFIYQQVGWSQLGANKQ